MTHPQNRYNDPVNETCDDEARWERRSTPSPRPPGGWPATHRVVVVDGVQRVELIPDKGGPT